MLIIPGPIFQSLTCDPAKIRRQDCIAIKSHSHNQPLFAPLLTTSASIRKAMGSRSHMKQLKVTALSKHFVTIKIQVATYTAA